MLTSLNFRKLITENKIIFNFVLFICMIFFINSSNNLCYDFSCIVLGVAEAGKTSVINSLLGEKYTDKYTQSIPLEFKSKEYKIDYKFVNLRFYTLQGEGKNYNFVKNFIENYKINIIILPVDKDELLGYLKKICADIKKDSSNCKYIIVLNKVDLNTKTEQEMEKLKIDCGGILKTNNLEGGVISFSAKTGEGINELNNEIEKILRELIKEEELLIKEKELPKKEEELPKKDNSKTGNNPYVDSMQVKKPINDVLDTTGPLKKNLNQKNLNQKNLNKNNHTQKKPITNTKKSASNNNGTEDTKQTQNCISCRAR